MNGVVVRATSFLSGAKVYIILCQKGILGSLKTRSSRVAARQMVYLL